MFCYGQIRLRVVFAFPDLSGARVFKPILHNYYFCSRQESEEKERLLAVYVFQ